MIGVYWRSSCEIGAFLIGRHQVQQTHHRGAERTPGGSPLTDQEAGLLGRVLGVCIVGYVLVYLAGPRPWLWYAYGTTWAAVCLVLAHRRGDLHPLPDEEDAGEPDEAGPGEEQQDEDTPQNDLETLGECDDEGDAAELAERARRIAMIRLRVEHKVAEAALLQGKKGVRTADILTSFQKEKAFVGWGEGEFIAALRGLGIPVRDQMHFVVDGKKRNLHGVHVDDLTQSLGRAPRLPANAIPDLTPENPKISPISMLKNTPRGDRQ